MIMNLRIPNRIQSQFLMLWHAIFSGGFVIAYLTVFFPLSLAKADVA